MEPSSTPLVVAHGSDVNQPGVLVFVTATRDITIEGYRDEILRILRWCNGQRKLEVIGKMSRVGSPLFEQLIEVLDREGVICDSRYWYEMAIRMSEYPLVAAYNHSPNDIAKLTLAAREKEFATGQRLPLPIVESELGKIARQRKSCRAFKPESLSVANIAGLLRVLYGTSDGARVIPSAGSLYPAKLFLVVLNDTETLRSGSYQYDYEKHELVSLQEGVDIAEISILLDSPSILRDASVVLFVASDISKSASKYANRGVRYALIEAGHVAQNAYLYCAEKDIGVVEYGGFNDQQSSRFFGLEYPREAVLTSLIIGVPDRKMSEKYVEEYADEEWKLRNTLVGKDKPVRNFGYRMYGYKGYQMPRYVGWCAFNSSNPVAPKSYARTNRSTGTGLSMQEAILKALAEGYERYCSGLVRFDRIAKENELDGAVLDLCGNAPLRAEYLQKTKLVARNPDDSFQWVKGTNLSGSETVYMPVDQVFYPMFQKNVDRKLTYLASSTGIATHFDREVAQLKALLELIERDAIAVTWYGRRVPRIIDPAALDDSLQNRIRRFEKVAKRKVYFLDLTLDSVPVIGCVIKGETYPRLTSGYGASFSAHKAVEKALDEAELMFHSWRGYPMHRRDVAMQNVTTVLDHVCYWAAEENQSKIDWLLSGSISSALPSDFSDTSELIRKYRPVAINLTPDANPSGLHVVKVASPVLMPINFGYMSEHYGHSRVSEAGYEWGWAYPALPHCLA